MITPDQAVEAAFYTGCNLRSFVEERADNLDWMGCDRADLDKVKRAAAGTVRALADQGMTPAAAADVVEAGLTAAGYIDRHTLTPGQHASFMAFAAVLTAIDGVCAQYAAERAAAARDGVTPAPAGPEDPEDGISQLAGDAFERVDEAPGYYPVKQAAAKDAQSKRGKGK